jgi:AAA+ superfamily predicted ATPase
MPPPSQSERASILEQATEALCVEVVYQFDKMPSEDQEFYREIWREPTKRILEAALLEDA